MISLSFPLQQRAVKFGDDAAAFAIGGPAQSAGVQEEITVEERAEAEEKAFADLVMNRVSTENRAGEIQLTQGNNGSIVPTTIANRIIKAVRDMVPFLQLSDVVYTSGTLFYHMVQSHPKGAEVDPVTATACHWRTGTSSTSPSLSFGSCASVRRSPHPRGVYHPHAQRGLQRTLGEVPAEHHLHHPQQYEMPR